MLLPISYVFYMSKLSLDRLTNAFSVHRDVHEHVGLSSFRFSWILEPSWQQLMSVAATQVDLCGTVDAIEFESMGGTCVQLQILLWRHADEVLDESDYPILASNECEYEELVYKGSGLAILCRKEWGYTMPGTWLHMKMIRYAGDLFLHVETSVLP